MTMPDWYESVREELNTHLEYTDDVLDLDAADNALLLTLVEEHYEGQRENIHDEITCEIALDIYDAVYEEMGVIESESPAIEPMGTDIAMVWFDIYNVINHFSQDLYTERMEKTENDGDQYKRTGGENFTHVTGRDTSNIGVGMRELGDVFSSYVEADDLDDNDSATFGIMAGTRQNFAAGNAEDYYRDVGGRFGLTNRCLEIKRKYVEEEGCALFEVRSAFTSLEHWAELKLRMQTGIFHSLAMEHIQEAEETEVEA